MDAIPGLQAISGAARLGYDATTTPSGAPPTPAQQAYEARRKLEADTDAAAAAQHPYAYGAGEFGSALIPVPGLAALKAGSLAVRAGRGLFSGLLVGGVLGGMLGAAIGPRARSVVDREVHAVPAEVSGAAERVTGATGEGGIATRPEGFPERAINAASTPVRGLIPEVADRSAADASQAGGDAPKLVALFHGTTGNAASKIFKNGFRTGRDGAVFFAEDFPTAAHFAEEAAAKHDAGSMTVLSVEVPAEVANALERGTIGDYRGLRFIDIPGSSGYERILIGDTRAFNASIHSMRRTRLLGWPWTTSN